MVALKKASGGLARRHKGVFLSRRFFLAVFFTLALVLLVVAYIIFRTDPPLEEGMKSLILAYGKVRVVEARLSGGFKAGEFLPRKDGIERIDPEVLGRAHDNLLEAASDERDLPAQLAYGRLLILEGDGKGAETRLRKVLDVMRDSAEARNDLGVSLLEQHKLEDALEEFELALEAAPQMEEARFNRALCYEKLLLTQAAIAEYDRAAKKGDANGWSNEARSRLEILSRPFEARRSEGEVINAFEHAMAERNMDEARRIADENFQALTRYALVDLTREHLNAAISGDREKGESALKMIEAIGTFFVETKGDRYIADSAEHLRKLDEKERPNELKLVSEYLDCVNACNSQDPSKRDAAFSRLGRLAEAFRARGNLTRAERADIRIAKHHYASNNLKAGIDKFEEIKTLAERKQWAYDLADIYAHLGISYGRAGQNSLGLKLCNEAVLILEKMREGQLKAKVLQFLSVIYGQLGSLDRALANYRESLKLVLTTEPRPAELAFNYFDMANLCRRWGNHELALLFSKQALSFSEKAEDFNRSAQIFSLMGLEHLALKQQEDANHSLNSSLSILGAVDARQRSFTEPLLYLQAGQAALISSGPAKALDYFTRARTLASKVEGNSFLLIRSLSGLAAANAAKGNIDEARADVAQVMKMIESYRGNIAESKYRSSFLEASQNAFDQVISLNITTFEDERSAFNITERARARALLDQIAMNAKKSDRAAKPDNAGTYDNATALNLDQVQAALPKDLTMIEYSVTEKQTYIFIVSRTGFDVVVSEAPTELIDRLVQRFLAALKSRAPIPQIKEQARELYEYLIKPVKEKVPPNSKVCVIPDKSLHFLPFAALVDTKGNYLIKSYKLSYAPSASVLVHCIEEEKKKATSGSERIVAIGDPAFDQDRFQRLDPLLDAVQEASQSASFYAERLVLKGEDATESRVLREMQQCDVAHLALHCLVEEESPWLAALVLARAKPAESEGVVSQTPVDDGVLYLDEVYKTEFLRTRLVVLSACQSGLGQYFRGEGVVSLVRPFISSGVPTVVASLWSVDSRATAPLMIDFHKERKQSGSSISEALRAAQESMSSGGLYEHPYYWAPFIAIGSAN
jgi:CHAT domain-containing protein/Flp pilus assembly protein TadD